jgi:hypothetical protein
MYIFTFAAYTLLLSYNPSDLFKYYNVTEMHGLSLAECEAHPNTTESAYIAGLCNYEPKESGDYSKDNKHFVFINLSRCTNDIRTMGLVMHEMMHLSGELYNGCWDSDEENIITWAEEEAYKVVEIIKQTKK